MFAKASFHFKKIALIIFPRRLLVYKNIAIAILAASLSFSAFTTSSYAKKLSGAEIKSLLSGKSFRYSGKTSGTSTYTSGGRMTVSDSKFGKLSGRWWVKGSSFCRKYPRGKAKCMTIRSLGGGKYRNSSGYTFSQ